MLTASFCLHFHLSSTDSSHYFSTLRFKPMGLEATNEQQFS
uniref:Uncharacterized protein n=1 Tax=Tetranychus urticae TaxID=32264 RepID=T1KEG2_TETUR